MDSSKNFLLKDFDSFTIFKSSGLKTIHSKYSLYSLIVFTKASFTLSIFSLLLIVISILSSKPSSYTSIIIRASSSPNLIKCELVLVLKLFPFKATLIASKILVLPEAFLPTIRFRPSQKSNSISQKFL